MPDEPCCVDVLEHAWPSRTVFVDDSSRLRVRLVSRESSVVSRRKPPSGPVTTPHSATGRFLMVPRFVGGFDMRILCQMHVVTYSGRLSAL
jgi:hypothetical protein